MDIRDCDEDDLVKALEQRLAYAKELLDRATHPFKPAPAREDVKAFIEKLNSEGL